MIILTGGMEKIIDLLIGVSIIAVFGFLFLRFMKMLNDE